MADAPRLRRFFVEALPAGGGRLALPRDSVKHVKVTRLQVGEQLELFDAVGWEATATLVELRGQRVVCDAAAPRRSAVRPRPVTLVLGLPKASRLENAVRMTTELGVAALHLAHCDRSVSGSEPSAQRLQRLQRVARTACAQSGQSTAPELHPPVPLLEAAARAPDGARRIVFWEQSRKPLDEVIVADAGAEAWAVIGPEGGLSETEVTALRQLGFEQASLGSAVMRVDTAAVVIAALLADRLGALRVEG